MKYIKNLFLRITGGRPMKYIDYAFTDVVTGKPVNYFRDRLNNQKYMAISAWSIFRVEAEDETK